MTDTTPSTDSPKTSFLTDAWKTVNAKMNREDVDSPETEGTQKRFALKRIIAGAAVIGAVVATTAIVTLKVAANAPETDEEIIEDDTDETIVED